MHPLARFLALSLALAPFVAPAYIHAAEADTPAAEASARSALPLPLIPMPREVSFAGGVTELAGAKLSGAEATKDPRVATAYARLKEAFGTGGGLPIRLSLTDAADAGREAYTLTVNATGATITAAAPEGLLHGATTLAQLRGLAKSTKVPHCVIRDEPKLKFRAVMHDIGRCYMAPDRIKRHIDILSRYKINIFHWHLTENAAWRFEVKSHPELTRAEFHEQDRDPGKFYTQKEIKEIIAYAKARGVTVMLEVDIPGHTAALRRALGVKKMDDPKVAPVLREVFTELLALTPAEDTPYIHIGTDETGPHDQMPRAFLNEIADMIHKSGRKSVCWNPGIRPPAGDDSIEMLWAKGKPNGANPFIDSRSIYINLNTGADAVRTTYWNVPATDGKPERRFGGGLALWLDMPTHDENIERVSPFWPAVVTFADRAWYGGQFREDLLLTMPKEGTDEARAYEAFDRAVVAHRDAFFRGVIFPYVREDGFWRLMGPIPNGGKRDTAFGPEKTPAQATAVTVDGKSYDWDHSARGWQVFIRHMFGWAGALDDAKPNTTPWRASEKFPAWKDSTVYARAILESDADKEVGFWIQVDPPNASDRREGPNPKAGEWNRDGAKVWINGVEIAPPKWTNPGRGKGGGPDRLPVAQRLPFSDEFCYMRPATKVKLKRGENTVLLRLPAGGPKWEFVCHPVEWDGVNAREAKGVSFKKW